uniref:Uncharacterized protein n=1 Tax=Macaca mulatta TaxID=9544 RepID=A0A5F8AEL1_MACMU
ERPFPRATEAKGSVHAARLPSASQTPALGLSLWKWLRGPGTALQPSLSLAGALLVLGVPGTPSGHGLRGELRALSFHIQGRLHHVPVPASSGHRWPEPSPHRGLHTSVPAQNHARVRLSRPTRGGRARSLGPRPYARVTRGARRTAHSRPEGEAGLTPGTRPLPAGRITLRDLKRCKLAGVFFDTFFNIEKYLDHEQKEQISLLRDSDGSGPELSDWEKYAAEEYDILVAEETAGEPWEDGFEAELSPVEQKLSALRSPLAQRPFFEAPSPLGAVDLYEYACGDEDLEPL